MDFTTPFLYKPVNSRDSKFPPSAVIQKDVEHNLDIFLHKSKSAIRNIVVVGAWHGDEVKSFLRYPNAKIFCFEPKKSDFAYLTELFSGEDRVVCFPYACGAENGRLTFYDTAHAGNSSLLPPTGQSSRVLQDSYFVEVKKLDAIPELKGISVDLLWADVQGYEMEVLKGAPQLLRHCAMLFLEVSKKPDAYSGAVSYADLKEFVKNFGFTPAAEGIDDIGDGNALFLQGSAAWIKNVFSDVPGRVVPHLDKLEAKNRLSQLFLWKMLPERMKIFLKKNILGKYF